MKLTNLIGAVLLCAGFIVAFGLLLGDFKNFYGVPLEPDGTALLPQGQKLLDTSSNNSNNFGVLLEEGKSGTGTSADTLPIKGYSAMRDTSKFIDVTGETISLFGAYLEIPVWVSILITLLGVIVAVMILQSLKSGGGPST